MARLTSGPDRQKAPEQSPPGPTTPDNDEAAQQLLSETLASASKKHTQQQTSAVVGANLLNAARADFHHSSPIRQARKTDHRKLVRPTITARDANQVIGPRRSVWEVPESPEKGDFVLPQTVNHKPLKRIKKRPDARRHGKHADGGEDDQNIPSSPPRLTSASVAEPEVTSHQGRKAKTNKSGPPYPDGSEQVTLEEKLPNGAIRCTVISYDPKHKIGYKQCLKASTTATKAGPRCATHVVKHGTMRCSAAVDTPDGSGQCRQVAQKDTFEHPLCSKHFKKQLGEGLAGQIESLRASQESAKTSATKRTLDEDDNQGPVKKLRGRPLDNVQKDSVPTIAVAIDEQDSGPLVNPNYIAATQPSSYLGQYGQRQDSSGNMLPSSIDVTQPTENNNIISISKQGNNDNDDYDDEDEDGDEDEDEKTNDKQAAKPSATATNGLHDVFEFVGNEEERSGTCHTKIGIDIKRVCESSIAFIEKGKDLTVGTVTDRTENVRAILKLVKEVKENRRRDFKMDAYNYIFRDLILYLQGMHDWFSEQDEQITQSFDAMYNLAPLVRDILTFKDTIASWRANVGSHRHGDRTIKDVDSHIISPLRKISAEYNKHQRILESRERARKQLADIERQAEEEEKALQQREDALIAKKERWKRWQNLHVKRMQCEPDPYRRRKLHIMRLEDFEEKDANGVQFERLPVFKDRTTPPLRWASTVAGEKEWEEDEEKALLEGLERYAGPQVFFKIFEKYCRPGGTLRRFTVTDIVVKAAWVKSSWVKLEQENGWEVPVWARKIPVLP